MRLFVELLTNGSPEERAATPEGQLSPLFEGGHGDLVKSITTISGPFNGITFPHALPKLVDGGLTYGLPLVASGTRCPSPPATTARSSAVLFPSSEKAANASWTATRTG